MTDFQPTDRTRVRRVANRASYDRDTIYSILDDALVAHVAFIAGDAPVVLPMAFVRVGDAVYLHGSTRARMFETIAGGAPICVTVTLLDGLVLARSAFHHSVNYRSVTIHGSGSVVAERDRALTVLRALTEKIASGRWEAVREPNEQEMKATLVVEIPIVEVSAKVRSGDPIDDEDDYALPIWAGSVAIERRYAEPVADARLPGDIEVPEHVRKLTRR